MGDEEQAGRQAGRRAGGRAGRHRQAHGLRVERFAELIASLAIEVDPGFVDPVGCRIHAILAQGRVVKPRPAPARPLHMLSPREPRSSGTPGPGAHVLTLTQPRRAQRSTRSPSSGALHATWPAGSRQEHDRSRAISRNLARMLMQRHARVTPTDPHTHTLQTRITCGGRHPKPQRRRRRLPPCPGPATSPA